ncbi:hypothetical protein CASFOL_041078 [Castilleja foliolosa]|uniref:Uncharacterized protein n=1 Tax=Castilleja foliolosa TaxID=1961234 RepID=A0ABD3BDM4_9LAMI
MARNRLLLCTFLVLLSIIFFITTSEADKVFDEIKKRRDTKKLKLDAMDNIKSRIDNILSCFKLFEHYRNRYKFDSLRDEVELDMCGAVWIILCARLD